MLIKSKIVTTPFARTRPFTKDIFMQATRNLQQAYLALQREGVAFVQIEADGSIRLYMNTLKQFMEVTGAQDYAIYHVENFGDTWTTYSWVKGKFEVVFQEREEGDVTQ